MKKRKMILSMLMGACFAISGVSCADNGDSGVGKVISFDTEKATVFDFSKKDGTKAQYIKKFDQFATTWGFVGDTPGSVRRTSINTIPAAAELKAENLRFDLFMGYTGLGYKIASTSELNGSTDAEYEQCMQVIKELVANDITPQLVLFANPAYSQPYGDWKSVPIGEKYQEVCRNMSTYFKEKGIKIGAYEIWNEPDLGNAYFSGNFQDYIDTYVWGAKGVKEGNSDAFVQALSASWIYLMCQTVESGYTTTQFERFIERAAAENILPDSISWHFYGRDGKLEDIKGLGGDGENFSVYRNGILTALHELQNGTSTRTDAQYAELCTLQQTLNEFNVYQPLVDASYKTTTIVPGMFDAMETLLAASDITRVNWATFLSEQTNGLGCNLIDTYSLQRYPAYHACWAYAHLPVDRIEQPTLENGLKTMASADDGRAGLLVYNPTENSQKTKIALQNLPFEKGDVTVYLIDNDYMTNSTYNNPYIVEEYKNTDLENLAAELEIASDSAYYIEVNGAESQSDTDVQNSLRNHIVRKDYYYPNRGDNTPYSEVHNNSMTAHLSMNNNATGATAVSLVLDDMKEVASLALQYELWGNYTASEDATLGIKIDYETDAGYTTSVYHALNGFSKDIVLPFGAKDVATNQVVFGETNEKTAQIALTEYAPNGWTGRITISYVMANAGAGATAKMILSK